MAEEYTGTVEVIAGFIPANNQTFPLMRAQDVLMDDGTRLNNFKPLPEVTEENNGQVLKVINGAWGVGLTIQAEVDSENSAQLNIF